MTKGESVESLPWMRAASASLRSWHRFSPASTCNRLTASPGTFSLLPAWQAGVNLDGCVEVDAAYYGLPTGWIGREVNVQWDELYVRILDPQNGLLLREHVRQKRGWDRIKKEDRPQHMPLQVPSYCGEPDEPVLTS